MTEIRGEKVVFDKGDFHRLDAMPSARHKHAAVLGLPTAPSLTRRCAIGIVVIVMLLVIALGTLFIALEEGYLDATLTARAEEALSTGLGQEFKPQVGKVRLRFSENWMLALAAVDVRITHVKTGIVALRTDSITAVLDPFALASGRFALARAEIGRADGDLRFLPPTPPLDWKTVRIDAVPTLLAALYPGLDRGIDALHNARTEGIFARSITLVLPEPTGLGDKVEVADFELSQRRGGHYFLTAAVNYGKLHPKLKATLDVADGKVRALAADLSQLDSEPIMLKYSEITGERREGIDVPLDIALMARRDQSLELGLKAGAGLFYGDGEAQPVSGARLSLAYDFKARKIAVTKGLIDLGQTIIPLEGTAIDLDRVNPGKPPGFALEVIANDAVADAATSGEPPENFNANVRGYYLPQTKELTLDTLAIATSSGTFAGSLKAQFVKPSPAINFAARVDALSVRSVKQLWPYWLARKVRHWALENIKGGTIRNAEIDVSLAAGRIPEHPQPLIFRDNELHVAFDAEDTSVRFAITMPASAHTYGHFLIQDRKVEVDIKRGEIPLPSGKLIKGGTGIFSIDDTAVKPLMATLNLSVAGEAAAAAEFAAFKPMNAMSHVPFAAADMTGNVTGDIAATFGLEKDQKPPDPDFTVNLALAKVGLRKPFQNRKISNFDGTLAIDPRTADLKGKADIDGMAFDLALTEPVGKTPGTQRRWSIEGNVTQDELRQAAPGLAAYVTGNVGIKIGRAAEEEQKARIDLTSTGLSIPVVGWRKGPGVPATAEFQLIEREGQTDIRDLVFAGDGFGARGNVVLDKRGLVSAKFSHVKLAAADDFALDLARKTGGMAVEVNGESIDLRPFLDRLKSPGDPVAASQDMGKTSDQIVATIGRANGYNNESLSSIILRMSTLKGKVSSMNFSAVTRSGQAVVISRNSDPATIKITAGDAGAFARFTDFYRNMNGGLLNIVLKARGATGWQGSVDIHNFALVNEERLKSIVSTRTGSDGRSLSDAVKTDINTNSQKFRRGFARVLLDGRVVKIENGIARGDQVGATFQGTVRDARGRTDMTGTFMPAYGLNSLFGQVPIIGSILGNGRDRGLLGITFKLEGPFDTPRLSVNPLSLIAPGVFRNIFEFE